MKLLSRSEELILLAVWRLQDNAYGVPIRRHLNQVTGRDWSVGAVYVPLDKLCKRGLLVADQGAPTNERGGRSKRFYRLTRLGLNALQETRQIQETMWAGLPTPSLAP